jgi:hypothetical protein
MVMIMMKGKASLDKNQLKILSLKAAEILIVKCLRKQKGFKKFVIPVVNLVHVPQLRRGPQLWRSEELQRKKIRQDRLVMLPRRKRQKEAQMKWVLPLVSLVHHRHRHLRKQFSLLLTCPAAVATVTQRSVPFA